MADQKLVEWLLRDVAEWNRMRSEMTKANPSQRLDFIDANLRSAILSGANLKRADFRNADLTNADFTNADLSYADLSNADLNSANLNSADLSSANLTNADLVASWLSGSDLRAADLSSADLSYADLSSADLKDTIFRSTVICGTDLSVALNLDFAVHQAPSSIGVDTLFSSKGKIPEAFLRGAGVPEDLITYLPSLFTSGRAIEFYSCFISYSHKDEEFAKRLFSRLRDSKLRVWFAPEEMKGGQKLFDQIDQAIRLHDKLLLVLSDQSIASAWVMTEIRRAREREVKEKRRVLFPIRLTDMGTLKEWTCFDADTGKDLAVEAREYFIPDFSNWKEHDSFEKAYERLLKDLRKSEEGPP